MRKQVDIAIVGGGPAGLAAALEARKTAPDASVLIIERDSNLGGILQQCIHNGFGLHFFGEELTGPEYAGRFIEQVEKTDIEVMTDTMVLEISNKRVITAINSVNGLMLIEAKAVVLAMGCRERTRGALNIPGTRPAGVYTAGCAQRLVNMEGFMPGKRVVILGSGDIGLIMARRMTWEGAKVELVAELMPYSSGLNRNIVQCLVDNGIPLKFNHTVVRILGRERVEGVVIAEVDPATRAPIPGTEQTYPCDTLLLSVGLIPENELSRGAGVEMDRVTNGAVVDEKRQTSIPGVFACGNVLHVHDLVDNVSNEAILAGHAAAEFVRNCYDEMIHLLNTMDGAAKTGSTQSAVQTAPEYHVVHGVNGVRYVVPQRITKGTGGKLDLYFRVGDAYRGATLVARCGEEVLLKRKKQIMTPGEMEKITVDAGKITGDVTLEIVEV